MNRRESLAKLMAASGALISMPSWAKGWTLSGLDHVSTFSPGAQETLSAVADAIIPAGNDIGALSVGVDKFLQKLFDRCYEKDVQDNIKAQLDALDQRARSAHGASFAAASQAQRQEVLLTMANSDTKPEKDFFNLVKSETIRGFSTSREVMVGYQKFKLVPGHYYGCVDVKA